MNGALVAAGLIFAMLAFALAFLSWRVAIAFATVAVVVAAISGAGLAVPAGLAFAGGWTSLAITALSVYWPRGAQANQWIGFALALNAGLWAGLITATDEHSVSVVTLAPVLLIGVPAAWCIGRGWDIAVRIVASWLLAVAILVGSIPHLVVHPGYVPDHNI